MKVFKSTQSLVFFRLAFNYIHLFIQNRCHVSLIHYKLSVWISALQFYSFIYLFKQLSCFIQSFIHYNVSVWISALEFYSFICSFKQLSCFIQSFIHSFIYYKVSVWISALQFYSFIHSFQKLSCFILYSFIHCQFGSVPPDIESIWCHVSDAGVGRPRAWYDGATSLWGTLWHAGTSSLG